MALAASELEATKYRAIAIINNIFERRVMSDTPNFAFKKGYGLIEVTDQVVHIKLSETRDLETNPIELHYYKGTIAFKQFVDWLRWSYHTHLNEYHVIVSYGGDTRYLHIYKTSRKGKTLFAHDIEMTTADAEALTMLMIGISEY